MKEHTSQGLSQRLHDKGFRGEHKCEWIPVYQKGAPDNTHWTVWKKNAIGRIGSAIPTYTFTELWVSLTTKQQLAVSSWIHEAETPVEAIGQYVEWLIDNKHMEVEG